MRRIVLGFSVVAALAAAGLAIAPRSAHFLVRAAQAAQTPPQAEQHDAMHSEHAGHMAAEGAKAAAAAEAPATAPGVRTAAWRQVTVAKDELLQLAEAMPADKYGWRPAPGVRSVGEGYMHVASANYFLPTFWGVNPPAGVDPRTFEKDGAEKAKVVATLKASFDHLHHAIEGMSDSDLGKPVNFFGRQLTAQDLVLGSASHAHEHLGQAIAYARMNGVVPPWSQAPPPQKGR